MRIQSLVNGAEWEITRSGKCDNDILRKDNDYISQFSPNIYFNDRTCKHWCFDTMLPSGKWLENISAAWPHGTLVFRATILYD